ncbi:hypothetical protein AAEO56_02345 [Flavobacterium sp. DGU11]|uniref:Uncharacterized protein n=1 Tax=Flavobacterium arundinis TaxID=3139143 RepID=A0ABU9HSF8_9FLAO
MKTDKILEKYSPEEIADSIVFKNPIPDIEKQEASNELAEARKRNRANLSEKDKLYAKVLQLRFLMEDYANSDVYDETRTFASFLKTYIKLIYKVNKKFAQDIDLKETELSLILRERRLPTEKVIVRLEIHSNNLIPALSWFKVVEKQREHELEKDIEFRQEQNKHVKNRLEFGNVV